MQSSLGNSKQKCCFSIIWSDNLGFAQKNMAKYCKLIRNNNDMFCVQKEA